ncbi:TatD family hydrolase [Ureibacillus aquaedulcis]|uniref:TatD family hydrolase n=1 Tax=Ureibacillus aquaedulcis TaxID=3058421 RepID=A0ABT8GKF7_9BACL|nr:TatD family hydrolase [Ureibacillus sp. BA0131]MDN4491905.1 TatD family hydrolase [Ureibacillus sp. BA0131]
MMIDAHIHLDHYEEQDRKEILNSLSEHGMVALVTVSFGLSSCIKNRSLSLEDSRIKAAFGFHPEQEIPSNEEVDELFSWMEEHIEEMVAVGEVGLPYYKKLESQVPLNYTPYIQLLDRFVAFAASHQKPIVLHAVYEDAHIACDLLEKHGVTKAHFHWFKGDEIVVRRIIENGYFISITPDCLYEDEIQELICKFPIEQMMVETDGPWPFEGPFTNQRTVPQMMVYSIKKIAELQNRSVKETTEILYENTKRFYRI